MSFTSWLLPAAVFGIIIHALIKGVPVLDCFMEGAKDGFKTFLNLLPPLVGLILGVSLLGASGALDVIVWLLTPISKITGLPAEVLPLTLLSPVSGSGSLAMYESLLKTCGADSFAGKVASVIMGSSETTFYAVTVYYGAVGVKKHASQSPPLS